MATLALSGGIPASISGGGVSDTLGKVTNFFVGWMTNWPILGFIVLMVVIILLVLFLTGWIVSAVVR